MGRQIRKESEFLARKKGYEFIKRVQDVVLSAVALLILWPLLLIIALIIVIDSPGESPLFLQTRVGMNGKEFRIHKFRTMIPHAETKLEELLEKNEMDGPVFKIKGDPRITRVGLFLRKSGLDELPQLIDIFVGNMSIVGPRPALPHEVMQYGEYEKERLMIKPGLTCYWQIQPHRNELSFREWMELDHKYMRERSLLVDWKIIFGTVGAVLNMEGE